MPDEVLLPPILMRHIADAEVEVISWAGAEGRLMMRVTKEIGPEVGLLTFSGVSHVNLAPRLTVEGIECGGLEPLPDGYLDAFCPGDRSLGEGERVFVLRGSWGPMYCVVAESVAYQADA
jgi:hypothetical protein